MKSEFLIVAETVMRHHRRPLSPREIVSYALENKLFSDNVAGRTPHQTMKAKLSVNIRRQGTNSKFVRTAPGRFYLRELVEEESLYQATPLAPPKERQRILVFPPALLDNLGRFQGIKKSWKKIAHAIWRSPQCGYLDRLEAESNNDCKQILTYVMVRRGQRILSYKRGTFNRVEEFLRGSLCVGFGGHVSEIDLNLFTTADLGVQQSAVRELKEEIVLPSADIRRLDRGEGLNIVGILNDDSSAVGRRHFAFVFEYWASDDPLWLQPKRGEKSITQLRWLAPASHEFSLWNFEYWSQLCIREFFSSSLRAQPSFRVRRKSRLRPPNLLLVLGPVGSGKSEATEVLKADFGYHEINSGRVLARLLGIPPVPDTPRGEFQKAAWEFIQTPGAPGQLAQAIWHELLATNRERVLIDGIRQRETIEEIKKLASGRRVGLLYVHTPPDIAYDFFCRRQSPQIDIHEFLDLREAPVEKEAESLIGASDAVLYNWSGRAQYRQVVRYLMQEIGVKEA